MSMIKTSIMMIITNMCYDDQTNMMTTMKYDQFKRRFLPQPTGLPGFRMSLIGICLMIIMMTMMMMMTMILMMMMMMRMRIVMVITRFIVNGEPELCGNASGAR